MLLRVVVWLYCFVDLVSLLVVWWFGGLRWFGFAFVASGLLVGCVCGFC